jgi:hypothetical protein
MIDIVKMYTLICDSCGADAFEGNEFSATSNQQYAVSCAEEEDWHTEGNKHYCPDCYEFDDEDNLVLISKPTT